MQLPTHLLKLIETLKLLPGIGTKSAERFAFEMASWDEAALVRMGTTILELPEKLHSCPECGALSDQESCSLCSPERASQKKLCIVASQKDVFQVERTGQYFGLYHVLGGLFSPLEGVGVEALGVPRIAERIRLQGVEEVVIALDSTLEGDATALYLKRELMPLGARLTRLAFGMPMGSSLDYVDRGTLGRALAERGSF